MRGKLPTGWRRVELRDVADVNPRADRLATEGDLTFLAMADVSESGEVINQTKVAAQGASVHGYTRFRRGDLLCAKITPCFENGKGADTASLLTTQGFGSTEFHVVRAGEMIHPRLLHQIIQSNEFRRRGEQFMTGSAGQKRVPADFLEAYGIALPPPGEQRRIVAVLDAWDRAIQTSEDIRELLAERRDVLVRNRVLGSRFPSSAFQIMRGARAPRGWRTLKLGAVADEVKRINRDGLALPVLSCTKSQGIVFSDEYFGKQVYSKDTSTYKRVRQGEFVYATNHIEEGSIGLQDICDEGLVSPMYTVFEVDASQVVAEFLRAVLKTETYRQMFEAHTSASVDRRGSLRWKEFAKLPIRLPSIAEQKRIVKVLNALGGECSLTGQRVQALRLQKRGLLKLLLTGEKRLLRDLPGMESTA